MTKPFIMMTPSFLTRVPSSLLTAILVISAISGCSKAGAAMLEATSSTTRLGGAAGSALVVTITSSDSWTISSDAGWLKAGQSSGSSGVSSVSFSYSKNADVAERSANIKVSSGSLTKSIAVTQEAGGFSVSTSNLTLESAIGSKATFTVSASGSWSIQASTKTAFDWLTIEPASGSAGKTEVTVSANAMNPDYDERNGYITVTCGGEKAPVNVIQKQKGAIILQSDRIEHGSAAGIFYVTLNSNVAYTVDIPSDCRSWLGKAGGTKSLSSHTEGFSIAEGTEESTREGKIIFKDATGIADTLFVFQSQADKLVLDQESMNVATAGGSIEVNVKSNLDYKVRLLDSPGWIRVVQTKATRSDKIYLQADENATSGERTAVLEVSAASSDLSATDGTLTDRITIKQLHKNSILIDKAGATLDQAGGSATFTLTAEADIKVEIPSDASWLSVGEQKKSGSTTTVTLKAGENRSYTQRTASVSFKNASNPGIATAASISQGALKDDGAHDNGVVYTEAKHTEGTGIPIVFMGDGFTKDELFYYDDAVKYAIDAFFSVEPYRTYRALFDIYSVEVVSAQSGISSDGSSNPLHTYYYQKYSSTGIYIKGGQPTAIEDYANKIPGICTYDGNLLIFVLMNDTARAGMTYMVTDGLAISLCPVIDKMEDDEFREVITHEGGGHGFGFLADEYVTNSEKATDAYIESIKKSWWPIGAYQNVDFTKEAASVIWARFLNDSRYAKADIGIFEGATQYGSGAFRASENSIMRTNVGEYNAPSREAIYKNIMKRAYGKSWKYDFEEFAKYDVKNLPKTAPRGCRAPEKAPEFKPFAQPTLVIRAAGDSTYHNLNDTGGTVIIGSPRK